MKRFALAKQRLRSGIEAERVGPLLAAMLRDVLEAIDAARTIDRTIVVTAEEAVKEIASGAEVIADPADAGQSEAALIGVAAAQQAESTRVLLLPGDCPLLAPGELDHLLTEVPERCVAIVPDRHETGTNALLIAPPDAIRPSFGEGSLERHVEIARAAGTPFSVERLPSLALDLDTPADVVALMVALESAGDRGRHTAKALGL